MKRTVFHPTLMDVDPRRRQEVADSLLIQEDHNAMANLPTRPLHHEYNHYFYDKFTTKASMTPWDYEDEIYER